MKFAKGVFWGAGIWGIVILTPLYFLFGRSSVVRPVRARICENVSCCFGG